jgi:hypothetical protein
MPPEDDKNRIEELKRSLYSRDAPDVRTRRKLHFSDVNNDMKPAWAEPAEDLPDVSLNENYEDHSMSFFIKLLIGSAVFCVIAVGIGAYLFLNGSNLVSGNNIAIVISGPVSIPGGQPVSFAVKVTNNNNNDIQMVDMSVVFPAGATDPNDSSKALTSYDQLLGDIPAGGATSTSVSAIIFGEENTEKDITIDLTYKVKGSSAIFTKEQSYAVLINSSPITVTVSSFSSVTSGQAFDMTVDLKSNSQDTLKNVLLKGQYPFGYTFISANIPPLSDKATWKIGDIPPGGDRSIIIHGSLQGEDTDIRAFHFSIGAQSSGNATAIGTEYGLVEKDLTIEKPFVSLGIGINSDSGTGDYVGKFNLPEQVKISWFNNLAVAVANVSVTVDLSGSAYDKTTVEPDSGYFDSAKDEIIWNQQTNPSLASIAAGDSGNVSFSITPADQSSSANPVIDPTVSISANISGDRTQESNVSGTLSAAESRTIKVSSSPTLSGRVVRTTGPFVNTGPIPPEAEQKTTYTIVWTIGNTSSVVDNAQVTATLPAYVTWLGSTSPSTEDITYDQNSGTVTWNVGTVNAYSSDSERREVDFQVSLLPSINQVQSAPTLVNQASLTAVDDFTKATISSTQDYLTTSFSTDPTYQSGDEAVIK